MPTTSFAAGAEWVRISIPLTEFGTDASDLHAVMFAALAAPGPFTVQIDEIRFEE